MRDIVQQSVHPRITVKMKGITNKYSLKSVIKKTLNLIKIGVILVNAICFPFFLKSSL